VQSLLTQKGAVVDVDLRRGPVLGKITFGICSIPVVFAWPIIANMTSSTKPEVGLHNTHQAARRGHQASAVGNMQRKFSKVFGRLIFEIRLRTDIQMYTRGDRNTSPRNVVAMNEKKEKNVTHNLIAS